MGGRRAKKLGGPKYQFNEAVYDNQREQRAKVDRPSTSLDAKAARREKVKKRISSKTRRGLSMRDVR